MSNNVFEVTEDRYRDALKLSEYAFQYKVADDEIGERIEQYRKYHSIYAIQDEHTKEIVAKSHLISFYITYHQQVIKMGGIAGVATYPEYRRKGYVRDMLTYSLKEMREKGITVSVLHPFQVDFYRRYGWELLCNLLSIKLTNHDLKPLAPAKGTIRRFTKEQHNTEIEQVYHQYALQFSGKLVRNTDQWLKVYDEGTIALYYDEKKIPQGYILYGIENGKLVVEELVVLTAEARRGLWNFLCQHDSMVKEIEIHTHSRDPLLYLLKDPCVRTEIKPYGMVRIVDVEKFLTYCPFRWDVAQGKEVKLQITDPFAPWNERTFVMGDKEVYVKDSCDEEDCVQLSINTLSAILFGYRRPQEMFGLGLIQGPTEAVTVLESLIPETHSYMIDYF
ncbi:enhanced intracellular survival protein Eis [Thermoactinomyces sp. DSM 45892]|uniref:GNAT family N-acetyltransferase n=1 Tax=Thermoactinomyces sp. DSM 45892 TaxID=1882753 RepID=UPI000896EA17|nr:GNAT family N-acetyltransferase [Thermoactinomyces sp. DSM 45892]SDY75678.1 Predicted acetyltransferase [Thermoactinomyces sp. DSM 45892]